MNKKNLLGFILTTFFTVTLISPGIQFINLQNKGYEYFQDTIILRNSPESLMSDIYLNKDGENYGKHYRIFLDSSNDIFLPLVNNTPREIVNDYIIGKGKKNQWYEYQIKGLTLNTREYAKNKTEFLEKYQAFNVTYFFMYNLWNSTSKWINEFGKFDPYKPGTKIFNLDETNKSEQLFFSEAHMKREKVKLVMEQFWEEDILKINWKLGVWYDWTRGSFINHAALAGFKNDSYTLINAGNKGPIRADSVFENSSFKIYDSSSSDVSGLNSIDEKLRKKAYETKIKNSNFIFSPLLIQSYLISVENKESWTGLERHTLTILVIWLVDTITFDSTKILKDEVINQRNITAYFSPSLSFSYRYKRTDSCFIPSYYWNSKITGTITVPFIYG